LARLRQLDEALKACPAPGAEQGAGAPQVLDGSALDALDTAATEVVLVVDRRHQSRHPVVDDDRRLEVRKVRDRRVQHAAVVARGRQDAPLRVAGFRAEQHELLVGGDRPPLDRDAHVGGGVEAAPVRSDCEYRAGRPGYIRERRRFRAVLGKSKGCRYAKRFGGERHPGSVDSLNDTAGWADTRA